MKENYAFIDSQNVKLAVQNLGWKIDWHRFRVYLKEKYYITKAFLFIGYIEGNVHLYSSLKEAGYICVFKPTVKHKHGKTKGNCDAELVLQAMIEYSNFDKAIIASGDGDFYCLVKYLIEQNKLEGVLVPDKDRFSALLKFKICRPYLRYMNDLQAKLEQKKKRPHKDKTL